jgi:hypothetical protein
VLWTAFIVLLSLWLMGFSIQVGWLLIDSLLVLGFRAGHQPTERQRAGRHRVPQETEMMKFVT